MTPRLVVLFCLVGLSAAEPTWTTLRVKWGVKVWNSDVFTKMPLTTSETGSYGFKEIKGECAGGKFLGYRYIKDDSPAVVLIYDSKGYIAGIQSGLPKDKVDRINTTYPFSSLPTFQLENGVYFRTAYFVDPSTICNSDRTNKQFNQNIGTGLWIQNGSDPIRDSFQVGMHESDMKDSKWTRSKCFVTMGRHYWYDLTEDMSCEKFFPFFLMYNRGKLTGFGFASVGYFDFSPRFEHPPKEVFSKFLDPVPKCLEEEYDIAGGFTTMHVFFSVRPWNLSC